MARPRSSRQSWSTERSRVGPERGIFKEEAQRFLGGRIERWATATALDARIRVGVFRAWLSKEGWWWHRWMRC